MKRFGLLFLIFAVVVVLAVVLVPMFAQAGHTRAGLHLSFALMCGMAITIKSADVIANKYATRAQGASGDYAQGVQQPKRPWQASTVAAKDAYAAGVNDAIGRDAFTKGVNSAGDDKWKRKAAGVGAQRFGPGVTAAKGDYQTGVQPYLDTLAGLTLPPRQPKGSPGNAARVQAVMDALRAKKLRG